MSGATVSLRQLTQRSGEVVALVAQTGEAVTVTDQGEPVAHIVPADTTSANERHSRWSAAPQPPPTGAITLN